MAPPPVPEPAIPDPIPVSPLPEKPVAAPVSSSPPPATTGTSRRRKPAKTSGLKLGNDLASMQAELERKAEEAKARYAQDEQIDYEVNPSIIVDERIFRQGIQQYAEKLKAINKMNLASILLNGQTTLTHNKWEFMVENELQMGMVEKEKELLPFLRTHLQVPELFMALSYDEAASRQESAIPYTDDEKLKVMMEKNPALRRLQEIFKTRIIY